MAEVIDLLEACRSSPENEEEARSDLTIFARKAFKRTVPRGRDRGPDASIFARRPRTEGLQFDPDLRFEDVVMDLREEVHPEPLTEEKLSPIVSRPLPKRARHRRSSVPYGLIGLVLIGLIVAGYAFRPHPKLASSEPAQPRTVAVVLTPERLAPVAMTPKAAAPDFRPLFNGKDFAGWAVESGNPEQWAVRDGAIVASSPNFSSRNYLLTHDEYSDFILRCEFDMEKGANSGITVRAVPREQMLRSGSLFDHPIIKLTDQTAFPREPSGTTHFLIDGTQFTVSGRTVDIRAGWNQLEVEVSGDTFRVTVNKRMLVDTKLAVGGTNGVIIPGLARKNGRIGLQAHTGKIRFRNIEIKELTASTPAAKPQFQPLFNGHDLTGWAGAVDDYEVVGGILSCRSGKPSVAIYEPVQRTDFVARVEFRVSPGAESGMEIRYPGQGNGGFTSMCEIQILDDTHPKYANVDARLFNGSAWGMAAAKRGHLKPLGEWNVQEVTVRGSTVKVELNGVVILDTDLAPIREFEGANRTPARTGPPAFSGSRAVLARTKAVSSIGRSRSATSPHRQPRRLCRCSTASTSGVGRPTRFTRGGWMVRDGVLVGSGSSASHLYTERDDYRDFRLHLEARINDGGNSGVFLRCPIFGPVEPNRSPVWPRGYEAQINSTHWNVDRTGSLRAGMNGQPVVTVREAIAPPGQWFDLELTARGNLIRIKVNDQVTANYIDDRRQYDRGSIALQTVGKLRPDDHETRVEFRKIEIMELNVTGEGRASLDRDRSVPAPASDELSRPTEASLSGMGPGWRSLAEEDFVNVNCDPRTWSWKDGVLHGTGQPDGVIRTRKPFTNFELVAQWRVLRSGGSSGIVVWTKEEYLTGLKPGAYMRGGIEVQILDHGFTEQYEKKTGKKADWFTTHGDVFPVGSSRMRPFPPVSPDGKRSFPFEAPEQRRERVESLLSALHRR